MSRGALVPEGHGVARDCVMHMTPHHSCCKTSRKGWKSLGKPEDKARSAPATIDTQGKFTDAAASHHALPQTAGDCGCYGAYQVWKFSCEDPYLLLITCGWLHGRTLGLALATASLHIRAAQQTTMTPHAVGRGRALAMPLGSRGQKL